MKINDFIEINKNLNIYEILYSARTANADRSAGIGKIVDLDDSWMRIKWIKNDTHRWWYKTQDIQQSFHVIDNNSILRLLYE